MNLLLLRAQFPILKPSVHAPTSALRPKIGTWHPLQEVSDDSLSE